MNLRGFYKSSRVLERERECARGNVVKLEMYGTGNE